MYVIHEIDEKTQKPQRLHPAKRRDKGKLSVRIGHKTIGPSTKQYRAASCQKSCVPILRVE